MTLKAKILIPLLSALSLFATFSAYAEDADTYITPDSWSKHYTPNGVEASTGSISIKNIADLSIGLTTRYQLRAADSTDSMMFQYFRARVSELKLGEGSVAINVNMRGGGDFNKPDLGVYNFFYNATNAETGRADLSYRLYQGNIVLDNVLRHTKLTAGRFYLDYIDNLKIDGVALRLGNENFAANLYYGLPVSFYTKGLNTQLVGGGADLKFATNTRVRADAKYFVDNSVHNSQTYLVKARADQKLTFANMFNMNIYAAASVMNGAWFYDAGIFGNVFPSATNYSIWAKGQINKVNEPVAQIVSDYDLVMGLESPYVMLGAKVFQGIWKYFAAGAAFETRINERESYSQRNYWRITGNIDFFRLIPNNYMSVTADYWSVDKHGNQSQSQQLFFGGRMTQVLTENADLWLGANLTNYRYRYQQVDLGAFAPIMYKDKKLDDYVYVAYAGASWAPLSWLKVQADYMFEYSAVVMHDNPANDKAHCVELWLNFIF